MPCSKGMTHCHRNCLHRQMVLAYRDARYAAELEREAETMGYDTEVRLYNRRMITFKDWLKAWRSHGEA